MADVDEVVRNKHREDVRLRGHNGFCNFQEFNWCWLIAIVQILLRNGEVFSILLDATFSTRPATLGEEVVCELAKLARLWMSDEQGSLERVLTRLGYLRPSLVEKDELGNYLHQCATEGLQAILHIFCGLQRPPYNQGSAFKRLFEIEMVKVDWSGTEECRQKAEFETTLLLGITSSTRSLSQALNKYFLVEQLESSESCIARCLVRTPQQLFLSWKRTQIVPEQTVTRAGAEDEVVHGLSYKLDNAIAFESHLSVAEYCTVECANASSTNYLLDAVLLHEGSTDSGHYYMLQRVADDQFLLRDDNHAPEKVSQDHVLANFQRRACGLLYTLLPGDSETAHVAETPSRPGAPACVVDIAHPYDDAEDARGLQEEIVKWRKMAAIHAFLQHFTAFQQGFPEVLDCKCVDTYRLEAAAWGLADDSSDDEDRSGPPLSSDSPGSSGGESGDEGSLLDGSPGQILAVTAARLAAIKAAMARGNARGDMTGLLHKAESLLSRINKVLVPPAAQNQAGGSPTYGLQALTRPSTSHLTQGSMSSADEMDSTNGSDDSSSGDASSGHSGLADPAEGSVSSTDSDRYSGDSSCEDASSGHREQASPADGRFDMMEDQGITVSADKGWKVHTVSPILTHPSLPQDSFTFTMDNDLGFGAKSPARAVSPLMPSASPLDHSASPLTFLADNALALGQQPHKVEPAAVKYPLRSMIQHSPSPPHMGLAILCPQHQSTSSLTTPGDEIPAGGLLSEGAEPVNASDSIRPIDLTTAVQSAAAEATTVEKDAEDSNAHKGAPTALSPAVQPTDPAMPQHSSALNSLADSTAVVQPEGDRPTSPKPGALCSSHDGSFTAAAGSAASPTEPHTGAQKTQHVSPIASTGAESTSSEGPRAGAALKKASGEGQKDANIAEAHAAKMSSAAMTTADAMPGVEHAGGKEGRTRAAGKGITNSNTKAAAAAGKATAGKRRPTGATAVPKHPPVKPSAQPQDSAAAADAAQLPRSKASASQVPFQAVDAPYLPKHQYGTRSAHAAVSSKLPSGIATMTSKQPVTAAPVRKQDSYKGAGVELSCAKPAVSKQPKARTSGSKGDKAGSDSVQQRAAVASQPPVAAIPAPAAKHSLLQAAALDGGKAGGVPAQHGAAAAAVKGPVTRAAARQQSKARPVSGPVAAEPTKPKRASRAAKETGEPKPAGTLRQQAKARVGTAPADPVSAEPVGASTARAAAQGRQERQTNPREGQGTLPSKPGPDVAFPSIEEVTFCKLCKKINSGLTGHENRALRGSLVQCSQDCSSKHFHLQLVGGPRHRSIKQLVLEWDRRKQELMKTCKSLWDFDGNRKRASQAGPAPAPQKRLKPTPESDLQLPGNQPVQPLVQPSTGSTAETAAAEAPGKAARARAAARRPRAASKRRAAAASGYAGQGPVLQRSSSLKQSTAPRDKPSEAAQPVAADKAEAAASSAAGPVRRSSRKRVLMSDGLEGAAHQSGARKRAKGPAGTEHKVVAGPEMPTPSRSSLEAAPAAVSTTSLPERVEVSQAAGSSNTKAAKEGQATCARSSGAQPQPSSTSVAAASQEACSSTAHHLGAHQAPSGTPPAGSISGGTYSGSDAVLPSDTQQPVSKAAGSISCDTVTGSGSVPTSDTQQPVSKAGGSSCCDTITGSGAVPTSDTQQPVSQAAGNRSCDTVTGSGAVPTSDTQQPVSKAAGSSSTSVTGQNPTLPRLGKRSERRLSGWQVSPRPAKRAKHAAADQAGSTTPSPFSTQCPELHSVVQQASGNGAHEQGMSSAGGQSAFPSASSLGTAHPHDSRAGQSSIAGVHRQSAPCIKSPDMQQRPGKLASATMTGDADTGSMQPQSAGNCSPVAGGRQFAAASASTNKQQRFDKHFVSISCVENHWPRQTEPAGDSSPVAGGRQFAAPLGRRVSAQAHASKPVHGSGAGNPFRQFGLPQSSNRDNIAGKQRQAGSHIAAQPKAALASPCVRHQPSLPGRAVPASMLQCPDKAASGSTEGQEAPSSSGADAAHGQRVPSNGTVNSVTQAALSNAAASEHSQPAASSCASGAARQPASNSSANALDSQAACGSRGSTTTALPLPDMRESSSFPEISQTQASRASVAQPQAPPATSLPQSRPTGCTCPRCTRRGPAAPLFDREKADKAGLNDAQTQLVDNLARQARLARPDRAASSFSSWRTWMGLDQSRFHQSSPSPQLHSELASDPMDIDTDTGDAYGTQHAAGSRICPTSGPGPANAPDVLPQSGSAAAATSGSLPGPVTGSQQATSPVTSPQAPTDSGRGLLGGLYRRLSNWVGSPCKDGSAASPSHRPA